MIKSQEVIRGETGGTESLGGIGYDRPFSPSEQAGAGIREPPAFRSVGMPCRVVVFCCAVAMLMLDPR